MFSCHIKIRTIFQLCRGGHSAVARESSKISAFVSQEHQIRVRSHERANKTLSTALDWSRSKASFPLASWWWFHQPLQNLVWSQKQVLRSAQAITYDGQLWQMLPLQSILEDIKPDYRNQRVIEGFCCCCLFVWGGRRVGVFPWLGKILQTVIAK